MPSTNTATSSYDIVVVGASLAGVRVAEQLRKHGHTGSLLLLGDEDHLPYDRPPLSKQVLTGDWDADRISLTSTTELAGQDIDVHLGSPAIDLDDRSIHLADGTRVEYRRLVVATGASARTWPGAAPGGRIHRLRTLDDSLRLREALRGGDELIVIGGGFIGLEVAAAARQHGVAVTLVEMASTPLEPILGPVIGACFARLHETAGVRLLMGNTVSQLDERENSVRLILADGSELSGDLVVAGIGAVPNNAWLSGLGLDDPGGVQCDRRGRAAESIWALGDVACWDEPAFADRARHEHWTTAVDQASVVAADVLGLAPTRPSELPYFWSTQYDVNFQLVGRPDLATSVDVIEPGKGGADRGTVFGFRREEELVAVGAFHNPGRFLKLRRELQQSRAGAMNS